MAEKTYRGLVCEVCDQQFVGKSPNRKFCSDDCRAIAYPNLKPKPKSQKVCVSCNITFYTSHAGKKTCSESCAEKYRQDRIRISRVESVEKFLAKKKEKEICREKILFCNEDEFSYWFGKSYWLFGIKRLLKHDRYFPDVVALDHKDRVLRIELEYDSANYKRHGHPLTADLIVSMFGSDDKAMGIPVISLLRKENGNVMLSGIAKQIASIGSFAVDSVAPESTYYESIGLTYPVDDVIRQQDSAA